MNNFLSNLPKVNIKKKKRLGRGLGSGKGSKSGRGTTRHQKARESIPLHFEGGQGRIVKKFPLLRGKGKNNSIKEKAFVIDLEVLNNLKDNSIVSRETLIKENIITNGKEKLPIKILANGQLKKKLIVKLPVSKKVKEAVEKLGGQVEP
ncbi:50S ribosomal protein L15 [Candidatus Roizmanbacteria bacterium CG_4_9_14_3_um_filter_33_18]|uniref:Large ribosomal subunit protein uL15 n=3 Tax=Candidatus Roizmaniibacteriota TaxID=1752723 RepID=A0A2M7U8Q1_9BACT|nr:MAG: 50S ribosomal protein L15 [Candidatus Roizmanbacteria bacterium CG22_combo_CG10-13_8_21_14_all_34_12]PIZ67539.1 MAG: 50S ribosomal protein L15 [Candidatus Roizmanbacteria bacterium CG_4_10_14_0_2_um_filter_33_96]PJA55447.1 MAG: 50S ribosomal protein L15 [Candidatus Roizmanbacteria bacterium CG_4_9_14_3_um_filter_33_18]